MNWVIYFITCYLFLVGVTQFGMSLRRLQQGCSFVSFFSRTASGTDRAVPAISPTATTYRQIQSTLCCIPSLYSLRKINIYLI
jgi:hypothetical protein